MRLADLWAKHGAGALDPASDATQDLFIFGVTDDSRDVRFGTPFCALPGTREDGVAFCAQAAPKGAQAIAIAQGPHREALQRALSALRSGDILVVAGKGHEDYQIVVERNAAGLPLLDSRGRPATKKIPFSDTKVIREIVSPIQSNSCRK